MWKERHVQMRKPYPSPGSDEKLILLYCPGRGSNSRPPAHRSFKHGQGVPRPYYTYRDDQHSRTDERPYYTRFPGEPATEVQRKHIIIHPHQCLHWWFDTMQYTNRTEPNYIDCWSRTIDPWSCNNILPSHILVNTRASLVCNYINAFCQFDTKKPIY